MISSQDGTEDRLPRAVFRPVRLARSPVGSGGTAAGARAGSSSAAGIAASAAGTAGGCGLLSAVGGRGTSPRGSAVTGAAVMGAAVTGTGGAGAGGAGAGGAGSVGRACGGNAGGAGWGTGGRAGPGRSCLAQPSAPGPVVPFPCGAAPYPAVSLGASWVTVASPGRGTADWSGSTPGNDIRAALSSAGSTCLRRGSKTHSATCSRPA